MNTSNFGAMILETSCNGTLSASVGSPSTAAWKAATICSRISYGVGLVPAVELAEGFFRVGAEKPRNTSTEYRSKYKQWQIYNICISTTYNICYVYIYIYIYLYLHTYTYTYTHTHTNSHVHRHTNNYNNKIRSCRYIRIVRVHMHRACASRSYLHHLLHLHRTYTTLMVQNVQQNSSLHTMWLWVHQ